MQPTICEHDYDGPDLVCWKCGDEGTGFNIQARWVLPVWRWLLVGPHEDPTGWPIHFAIYPRRA